MKEEQDQIQELIVHFTGWLNTNILTKTKIKIHALDIYSQFYTNVHPGIVNKLYINDTVGIIIALSVIRLSYTEIISLTNIAKACLTLRSSLKMSLLKMFELAGIRFKSIKKAIWHISHMHDNKINTLFSEMIRDYSMYQNYMFMSIEIDYASGIDFNKELTWMVMGYNYYFKSEFLDAEECFADALCINPDNPDNWINLGNLYMKWGKFRTVDPYYGKAIELLNKK